MTFIRIVKTARRAAQNVALCVGVCGVTSCEPPAPTLPEATEPCPPFVEGVVNFELNGVTHAVELFFDAGAVRDKDGPLVLSYGAPEIAFGSAGLQRIKDLGGVVAFPRSLGDPRPLADQVVACASSAVGIDARRIHAVGYSYYGVPSAARLGITRSSYIASVATMTGLPNGEDAYQDASNKVPALVIYDWEFHPESDSFLAPGSVAYVDRLRAAGHFALLCGQFGGPAPRPYIVQFLLDHPYRSDPSPYATALPAELTPFCPPAWLGVGLPLN